MPHRTSLPCSCLHHLWKWSHGWMMQLLPTTIIGWSDGATLPVSVLRVGAWPKAAWTLKCTSTLEEVSRGRMFIIALTCEHRNSILMSRLFFSGLWGFAVGTHLAVVRQHARMRLQSDRMPKSRNAALKAHFALRASRKGCRTSRDACIWSLV